MLLIKILLYIYIYMLQGDTQNSKPAESLSYDSTSIWYI